MTVLMQVERLIMQGAGVNKKCYVFLIEQQGELLRCAGRYNLNLLYIW